MMETAESATVVDTTQTMISTKGLVKVYGKREVVSGVDLNVNSGEVVGLLGPNGAGKTTTVEIMEGVLPPTSGTVHFRGEPIGRQFRAEAGCLLYTSDAADD